jgi:hypothetical protein
MSDLIPTPPQSHMVKPCPPPATPKESLRPSSPRTPAPSPDQRHAGDRTVRPDQPPSPTAVQYYFIPLGRRSTSHRAASQRLFTAAAHSPVLAGKRGGSRRRRPGRTSSLGPARTQASTLVESGPLDEAYRLAGETPPPRNTSRPAATSTPATTRPRSR